MMKNLIQARKAAVRTNRLADWVLNSCKWWSRSRFCLLIKRRSSSRNQRFFKTCLREPGRLWCWVWMLRSFREAKTSWCKGKQHSHLWLFTRAKRNSHIVWTCSNRRPKDVSSQSKCWLTKNRIWVLATRLWFSRATSCSEASTWFRMQISMTQYRWRPSPWWPRANTRSSAWNVCLMSPRRSWAPKCFPSR